MMAGDAARGGYLVTLNGCGCHFNRDAGNFSGGNKFEGPFGVVYSANLTPAEGGIGGWTEAQFVAALRTGAEPDGEVIAPAMPYAFYGSFLSDQDAYDLAAYFLSLEPAAADHPENEIQGELEAFAPAEPLPAAMPSDPVARGEYLVKWSNCARCHTPANEDGSPKADMFLAGGRTIGEELSANITPDEETGIGSWTEEQIATFMRTGAEPNGEQIEGAMGNQIKNRYSQLTEEDAAAIAAFLKSIPAVSNKVGGE
jgi:mono/diheme cytochrome c family protein